MGAPKRAASGRTVTVDGITVTVAIDPKDDWEFATSLRQATPTTGEGVQPRRFLINFAT